MQKPKPAERAARDVRRVSIDPISTRLIRRLTQLGNSRFLMRDLGGLLLIAVGALTLLSLLGLAQGRWLLALSGFLKRGIGFGAFVLSVLAIGIGVPVVLRKRMVFTASTLIRILCAEVAFLAFLALMHNMAVGVNPYELMQSGGGGGAVGWVLSEMIWKLFGVDGGAAAISAGRVLSIIFWLSLLAATAWVVAAPLLAPGPLAAPDDVGVADPGDVEGRDQVWAPEQSVARGGKGKQLPLPDPAELKTTAKKPPFRADPEDAGLKGQADAARDKGARGREKADKTKPVRAAVSGPAGPIEIKSNATIINSDGDKSAGEKRATGKAGAKQDKAVKFVPRPDTLPPIELLKSVKGVKVSDADIKRQADIIETTLAQFGLAGKVVEIRRGPTVTQFGIEPGYLEKPGQNGEKRQQKIRVSQIASLQNDFALALSAQSLRVEAPIPGRSLVGIEVPNTSTSMVDLRGLMEGDGFRAMAAKSPLAFALGRDVSGTPVSADLGRMPHILVAGTTGSGKSVCISAITVCLAMNNRPEDLKLVMIDPKMVELSRFAGLPHIIGKPESDIERIPAVLRWVTREMDSRYKKFAEIGARHLADYNEIISKRGEEPLSRIVLLIDELADLMMQSPIETEKTLCRLAQMARATGIHMVVATQRPSVDVVTGLIKANFPARIAFSVASAMDSRVILDQVGAEALLGRGDMLFQNPEMGTPQRLQGCFVSDKEVEGLIGWWKKEIQSEKATAGPVDAEIEPGNGPDEYVANRKPEMDTPWDMVVAEMAHERAMASPGGKGGRGGGGSGSAPIDDSGGDDDLITKAMDLIRTSGTVSTSLLQRKLRVGYPRAARLMEELQEMGYVGSASKQAGKGREVRGQESAPDDGDDG